MRTAIEEFNGDVSACRCEQIIVAHTKPIAGVVAAGIPRIYGGHSAGVRGDQSRKGKDAMSIVAAAGDKRGNHRMPQSREHSFALATVIQCIFSESFCQAIPGSRAYPCDSEVGPESLTVTFGSLLPFWRSTLRLVEAGRKCRA